VAEREREFFEMENPSTNCRTEETMKKGLLLNIAIENIVVQNYVMRRTRGYYRCQWEW
jgi:hypothetical protein